MQDATPPASFDIRKLYQTQKKRDNYRQEMYDSVLRKAHCRIETVAARKETACLVQIPGFLLGMPLYDPYQCCGYVLQRLKTDGFVVSYVHPNTLRIDWSRHLIEAHVQRLEAHDAAEAKKAASRAAFASSSSASTTTRRTEAAGSATSVAVGDLPTVTIPSMDYQPTGKLFQ